MKLDVRYQGSLPAIAVLLTLLTGCVNGPSVAIEERTPAQFPTENTINEPVAQADAAIHENETAEGVQAARATRQLLLAADAELEAQRYDAAAAAVERAIRIAPQNARAWHQLARIRFASGDYPQAKATALRADALPGVSSTVSAANWFLIAEVERKLGDSDAAGRAYRKAQGKLGEAR